MELRSRGRHRLIRLVSFAALGAVGVVLWAALRPRPPQPPLRFGFWYWHQPFRIVPGDAARLRAAGVDTLFVRAGTIVRDSDSGELRCVLPQTWATNAPGLAVHLVFNADYSVVRNLDRIDDAALGAAFADAIRQQCVRARNAGVAVAGIQLDFDYPTRLLPRYATLLTILRPAIRAAAPQGAFSITALPTWLTSRDLETVVDKVDFFAPQFYEADIPRTLDTFATIGNEARLRRGLARAGRLNAPFWAGIPAYGHALVYDGKGRLRGAFHDAGVLDMARQPYYRLIRAWPAGTNGKPSQNPADFSGENIVELGPSGTGVPDQVDFHLIYDLPTPVLPARQIAILRADRPANCVGAILYRFPEANPTEAVPLPSILSVLAGKTPRPHLKVVVYNRAYAPWRTIEGGDAGNDSRPARNVFVSVTNDGDGSAGVGPDAAQVAVRFDRPGLGEIAPGGWDAVLPFSGTPENRSSLARANGVQLTALFLAPGETLIGGPFRVAADARFLGGVWRTTSDGGFTVTTGSFGSAALPNVPTPTIRKAIP